MGFLLDKCKLKKMDDEILSTCHPFTCGDEDLDDFFLHDAMRYKAELLGKTYCFVLDDDPKTIVCMFTLSNVSIGECRIVCLDKVSYLCTVILNLSNYGTRQETVKQQAKVRRGCNW